MPRSVTSPMDGLELVARWMAWLEARGLSPHTIRLYRTGVVRFLTEQVGGHPSRASEDDVVAFLRGVGKQGPAGRNQYLRGLRSFYGWCARRKFAPNPCADLATKKPRARPQVALSDEELTRLVYAAACRDERRGWALLLTFGLGARRAEVSHVRPLDADGDRVLLRVCKGGKSRYVETGPIAKAALEGLRPTYNGTVLGGIKPATLGRWAAQAASDAGLREKVRGRSAHVLRASFATHLLSQGTPTHVVRDLLGHESISTTSLYAVSFERDRREAVERLEA